MGPCTKYLDHQLLGIVCVGREVTSFRITILFGLSRITIRLRKKELISNLPQLVRKYEKAARNDRVRIEYSQKQQAAHLSHY